MTADTTAALKSAINGRFDYAALTECAFLLSETYKFLEFSYLGESVAGRGIPMFRVGSGKKEIYYIGGHHGAERITGALLIRFLWELSECISRGKDIFNLDLNYILQNRVLYIIPILNADGADIAANGAPRDSLLYSRLVAMNGSEDFTKWQANARGVDLNHNYDAGFAEYKQVEKSFGISGGAPTRYSGPSAESEPETGALCNYLRFNNPTAIMTLHTQGREIYCTSGGESPKGAVANANYMAKLCGYRVANPEGAAAYGGLTDFCIRKLKIPSFTFECGKGENPLPPSDLPMMYAEMRRVLFEFPMLF